MSCWKKKARRRSKWRMTTVEVFAPAKINLALHVTGHRADGYHELDTLVTFAGVGDYLRLTPYDVSSITIEGPEAAGVPADMDNLALRAAALCPGGQAVSIVLDKHLPVASGVGGGSADAAAAFRGALMLGAAAESPADTAATMPEALLAPHAPALAALGADVPMCLRAAPLRARGIGDALRFVPLPPVPAVLVNPRVPVSTPEVFRALTSRENPGLPALPNGFADARALITWLGGTRNDLEAAAVSVAPEISDVLAVLNGLEGVGLARMSGSGATCFALFDDLEAAKAASATLRSMRPHWWVAGSVLKDWSREALARVM